MKTLVKLRISTNSGLFQMGYYSAFPNPLITINCGVVEYPTKFEVEIFLESMFATMKVANTSRAVQCIVDTNTVSMSKRTSLRNVR